jgi:mRNA-degrading endonuclease RelE of RelBE toxin-antitoxin system
MTPYRVRYTPVAAESIRRLHPSVKQAIRQAIRDLTEDPFLGHPLTFELTGFRSLRVSRYRVISRIQEGNRTVEIHLAGPRKDIYEVFREFLERTAPD